MAEGLWKVLILLGGVVVFAAIFQIFHLHRRSMQFTLYLCIIGILYMTLLSRGKGIRELRLLPFSSYAVFFEYFSAKPYSGPRYAVIEILNNIILFIPFAYLLKCLDVKTAYVLLICFLFSLLIEICQYCFSLGVSEIDDIISNTIGGVVGVILYRLFCRQGKRREPNKGTEENE